VPLPQTDDFPIDQCIQAQIFVHWVQLCRLMGQIQSQMLSARQTGIGIPTSPIAASLIGWLKSIPAAVKLSISTAETATFQKDVYLLHLPYLTTVALVYLNRTGQNLPEISIAAVLAAICTARILRDFLLHSTVRALPESTGWSIAIAITALMHVCPVETFEAHMQADIRTLLAALEHMSAIWTSSKIMLVGLRKLIAASQRDAPLRQRGEEVRQPNPFMEHGSFLVPCARNVNDLTANDGVLWSDFFPFASADTSPSFHAILAEVQDNFQLFEVTTDFAELFDTFWSDFVSDSPEWTLDTSA
jgi:hypothetical protein